MSDEKYFNETLDEMANWAESIAGEWDGDWPGVEEDRAHQAQDILEGIAKLKELITEMGEMSVSIPEDDNGGLR